MLYEVITSSIVIIPATDDYDINGETGVHMNILPSGDGTVMVFHGEFKHQIIAGYRLAEQGSEYYNIPVPYTDVDGMLESFVMVWLAGAVSFGDVGEDNPQTAYPLANIQGTVINNKSTGKLNRIDLSYNFV